MNTTDDPVWIYFDSQHKHILAHLRKIYADSNNAIQSQQTDSSLKPGLDVDPSYSEAREELKSTPGQLNEDLRSSILALDSATPENIHSERLQTFLLVLIENIVCR
jgi:hypothetical protein